MFSCQHGLAAAVIAKFASNVCIYACSEARMHRKGRSTVCGFFGLASLWMSFGSCLAHTSTCMDMYMDQLFSSLNAPDTFLCMSQTMQRQQSFLFMLQGLLAQFASQAGLWQRAVKTMAELDALMSLAYAAQFGVDGGPMCRPTFVEPHPSDQSSGHVRTCAALCVPVIMSSQS